MKSFTPQQITKDLIDNAISQSNNGKALSEVLVFCIRIAKQTKDIEFERWLNLESNGYLDTNQVYKGDEVPKYRTVSGNYYDTNKRIILIEDPELSYLNQVRLRYGISELEELIARGTTAQIQDASMHKLLEKHLQVNVKVFVFSTSEMRAVITQIKTILLTRLSEMENQIATTSELSTVSPDKTHVFIVHGHDELAKTEAARFVEKLGFTPIILHEQVSSGKTIIEKIETYSNVGFGIVLYTPCDLGAVKSQDGNLQPRARQNVVFEHGYLIGKLGRQNVSALVKGNVELPNDMSGIVYIPMDSHQAWQYKIADEMKACGYLVDKNSL